MANENRLQEIMYERKLTYRQLSRMSGVSIASLFDIANFRADPKCSTMVAISHALKLPVSEVFNLEWRKWNE